jgi:hypothetical protein
LNTHCTWYRIWLQLGAAPRAPDILIPAVGISFGIGGYDYNFCKSCIGGLTAEQFWKRLFDMHGCVYPPVLS